MNAIVALGYRLFGAKLEERTVEMGQLQQKLLRAHMNERAAAYAATLLLIGIVAASWTALVLAVVLVLAGAPTVVLVLAPPVLALVAGASVVGGGVAYLDLQRQELAADIDENLPQALNYMLALANAGLPPKAVWASLARQPVFGHIRHEAERIHRDLDLFGHDLLLALRHAQARTPSKRFAEFIQGAISAFRSGVELGTYLKTKSTQYQFEAEQVQKENLDTIGVMAESFLVVVVAAPLFMIIMLTVMAISQGDKVILYGLVLILGYIPLAQLGIGWVIKSMNPRVWT